MFTKKILKSAIFLALLFTLASCYTRFGMARVEPVEEEYGYEGEPAREEIYENEVMVYRHVYINRYYHPGHFYFDPYDAWYFEPGIHFSLGYYYGPVYYTPVHYIPPYYGSPVYVCIPPVYYPPYWHPVHYPGHHPVYYPGPYYGGGSGPYYGHSPKTLKRRNFGKRSDTAIASKTTLRRRGGGSQLTRRTVSSGTTNNGEPYNRRISSNKRRNNTPDTGNGTYTRQVVRRRSDNSGSSGNNSGISRRKTNSGTSKTYNIPKSNGVKSGPGYSSPRKKSSTKVSREIKQPGQSYAVKFRFEKLVSIAVSLIQFQSLKWFIKIQQQFK
jgi:hypothetical protein